MAILQSKHANLAACRDALNRHLPRCTVRPGLAAAELRIPSARVNRSCQACSERKVRCSRGHPCKRCAGIGVACHYLLHGTATQHSNAAHLPTLGSNMSVSAGMAASSSASTEDTAAFSVAPQDHHLSVSPDEQLVLSEIEGLNPWLSWDWDELQGGVLESIPFTPTLLSGSTDGAVIDFGSSASRGANVRGSVADIINAKIDPVENHRQCILAFLERATPQLGSGGNLQWLAQAHFPLLLKTYFTRHHRHTPIIHLPTFDIVACPASLIFALALIAASYIPSLGLRARNLPGLVKCAYQMTVESDEVGRPEQHWTCFPNLLTSYRH